MNHKSLTKQRLSFFLTILLLAVACLQVYYLSKYLRVGKDIYPKYLYSALSDKDSLQFDSHDFFTPEDSLQFNLISSFFGNLFLSFHDDFDSFGEHYSLDTLSVFCFRGNAMRNNPTRGVLSSRPNNIELVWDFQTQYDGTTTEYGTWGGGAGWTGQPMVIRWDKNQKLQLGISDSNFINNDDALEVIIGSLCGNIYFLNSETGKPTREHLSIGNPIKGSISVDPRKNGLLYVGQGIQHTDKFGAYIFDMFTREQIFYINGKDKDALRQWGAFDSNPLIDDKTGQIFWPAENGLIYSFYINNEKKISPLFKMRYEHSKLFRYGIESSLALIDGYGFFTDNSGSVICIDLKTLRTVWNVSNDDDSDASITVDREKDGKYFLYTGNEVDRLAPINIAYFRKLDAATGQEIWKVGRRCRGTDLHGKTNSGGMLSSPAIGKHKGKELVYCIFSRVDDGNRGEFLAINKKTGKEEFSVFMDMYSWSSPVDIYDQEGNIYVFFTDVVGNIYLVDGISGELLFKKKLNYTFESSPIVINNQIERG
jgi:outer membrane protein assembly factor BamB